MVRKKLMHSAAVLLLLAGGVTAFPAAAQTQPQEEVNDIVVTARRSGAPTWTIKTDRGTIVLVGDLPKIPKATPWRPERLQAATARAQRVILGVKANVSVGDVFRLIFSGSRLTKLPKGRTAADYLDRPLLRRLSMLERRYDKDYSRDNFIVTAYDLLQNRLKFEKDTTTEASDVVRKAASRERVPARPVGTIRGKDMIDNLFEADARTHIPCLRAAVAAAEAGPQIVTDRGRAWTEFDIPAVMNNPLEVAIGQCWPWNADGLGQELREQWVGAIAEATSQTGVTLGVVPVRILAEDGGVLDQLRSRGYAIKGPAWR
jgi:hypothetical protein